MNRKLLKLITAVGCTGFLVFYLEIVSYGERAHSWALLNENEMRGKNSEPLKVLIVADPHIQGEDNEPLFMGTFSCWDADRYLQRTYSLAKNHVKPNVVIFLGDLFDEGSKSQDAQYRRYLSRFRNVFDLPKKGDPSDINFIFLPGNKDLGGGGSEPVSDIKLKWFNQTFGDYNKLVSVRKSGMDLQFVQYHKFLPEKSRSPSFGLEEETRQPRFRILLSHMPILSFVSESVQTVIDLVNPSLVLSAHQHQSTYYKLEHGPRNSIHTSVVKKFLMTKPSSSGDASEYQIHSTSSQDPYFRFKLNPPGDGTLHEISVPTCSYRTGVSDMGYGYLKIYPDGTAAYTVLWTPSRFNQLYAYMIIYILTKIVGTAWMIKKFGMFFYLKWKNYRSSHEKIYHIV